MGGDAAVFYFFVGLLQRALFLVAHAHVDAHQGGGIPLVKAPKPAQLRLSLCRLHRCKGGRQQAPHAVVGGIEDLAILQGKNQAARGKGHDRDLGQLVDVSVFHRILKIIRRKAERKHRKFLLHQAGKGAGAHRERQDLVATGAALGGQ